MKHLLYVFTLAFLAMGLLPSCSSYDTVFDTEGRAYDATALDELRGRSSGRRDAEAMRFADNVIAKAGTAEMEHGTWYNGQVRYVEWDYAPGVLHYTAQRHAEHADGWRFFQGPNPPRGYYTPSKQKRTIFIGGPGAPYPRDEAFAAAQRRWWQFWRK